MTDPTRQPWRTEGVQVTVWTVDGQYLGMMASNTLAVRVVAAHNAALEHEQEALSMADDDRPVRQPQDVEREAANQDALRSMTKEQLREMADNLGLDIPASATKAEILAALGVVDA